MKKTATLLALYLLIFSGIVKGQSFFNATGGAIPDNNTEVCFPIVVSGLPNQMTSLFGVVGVCLDITHTYDGDLKIWLKAPDNTTVLLSNNNGGGGDNYTSTCFAENGTNWIGLSSPPFTGTFYPDYSINAFNSGIDPNGTWLLCIKDEVPADFGNLNYWNISFGNNPPADPGLPPGVCSTTNASGCYCADTTITNCDLLPDMTASGLIIQNEHTEYPGYLTLSNATPNIGNGPLEIRGINVCYCDTQIVGCNTPICPDGVTYPKQLITQRIYHKDTTAMTYWDHPAGTMTYHPSHGHMHVDNWASYTLRVGTSDPNPVNWPIMGSGSKISFCLINLGTCSGSPGYCLDTAGNVVTGTDLLNAGLGSVSGCGNEQGIYVGSLDIYGQGLSGQQIDFPGICNGDYYIVSITDPDNHFLETNDNNNYCAVPVTLTQQGTGPLNPTFTSTPNGLTVDFNSNIPGVTAYHWDFGDGDSSNVNTVTHTYAAPGTYTVTLLLYNGVCTSMVAQLVTVNNTVGTTELTSTLTNVNIVPNPFNDNTTLSYKLSKTSNIKINIYNTLGSVVSELENGIQAAGTYDYKVKDLAAGTYFIKIITDFGQSTHKLVKLR